MRDYLIYSTIVGIVLALAVLLRLAVKRMAKRKECLCDSCQHLRYRNRGVFSNTYRCPEDDGYSHLYSHKNLDFCEKYTPRDKEPAPAPETKHTKDAFLAGFDGDQNAAKQAGYYIDYAQALQNATVQSAYRVTWERLANAASQFSTVPPKEAPHEL